MTKPKAPTSSPTAEPVSDDSLTGSQAEYKRFVPAARALPESAVIAFCADANLDNHSVRAGLNALLAREADALALPNTDGDALKCLDLAFAVEQVPRGGSTGELAPKLARASVLCKRLFRGEYLEAQDRSRNEARRVATFESPHECSRCKGVLLRASTALRSQPLAL
ncbi:MAG: hypothetical protein Q8Q09_17015 [Deltaproteobacteria bacterium]|nr:hypothetical protein [Deltaproteobacteria bacterium]